MEFMGEFGSAIPEQRKIAEDYAQTKVLDCQARIVAIEKRIVALEMHMVAMCEAIVELGKLHRDLAQTLWLASQPTEGVN